MESASKCRFGSFKGAKPPSKHGFISVSSALAAASDEELFGEARRRLEESYKKARYESDETKMSKRKTTLELFDALSELYQNTMTSSGR